MNEHSIVLKADTTAVDKMGVSLKTLATNGKEVEVVIKSLTGILTSFAGSQDKSTESTKRKTTAANAEIDSVVKQQNENQKLVLTLTSQIKAMQALQIAMDNDIQIRASSAVQRRIYNSLLASGNSIVENETIINAKKVEVLKQENAVLTATTIAQIGLTDAERKAITAKAQHAIEVKKVTDAVKAEYVASQQVTAAADAHIAAYKGRAAASRAYQEQLGKEIIALQKRELQSTGLSAGNKTLFSPITQDPNVVRAYNDALSTMNGKVTSVAQSTSLLNKYSHQFGRTLFDLTPIISGLGLLTLAHGAIQATDQYTKLTSQLKNATNSTAEYGTAMAEVKRISSAAQVDIGAIASLYQRLSLALQASGTSQRDIAAITETVSLGLKANGASARESASAMLQLSQSFGSGRMAGEEFNSMAEAAPNILRALAVSMKVPYGALKGLAAEGKITTEVMAKAFTDPALLESFRTQAASMRTITGSWVELTNALVLYVGETSKASGGVGVISGAITFLAENVKFLANTMMFAAGVMGMTYIVGLVKSVSMTIALTEATAINNLMSLQAARTTQMYAATQAELAVATTAVAAAQARATASSVTGIMAIGVALRTAAMAHPITAAALAIGTIIVAIANWESVTSGAKATFTWFKDDFLGGFEFLTKAVGISFGELVQKMGLLANLTLPDLKSGKFKAQWDELTKLSEQLKIEAAGGLAGVDMRSAAQIEEANKKLLVLSTEAWNKLHQTKEQQRAADISSLNEFYLKEISARGLSQDVQLKLAGEYQVKLALINEQYNKKGIKEANAAAESAAKETAASQAKIAVMNIEMATGNKLTESQKELVKLGFEQQQSAIKLTASEYERQKAMLTGLAITEKKVVANDAAKKAEEEFLKLSKQIANESNNEIESIDKKIIAQEKHNAEIGKTPSQIAAIASAAELVIIKEMELESQAIRSAASIVDMDQQYKDLYIRRANALDEQINKRKQLAKLEGDASIIEADKAAIEKETKWWADMWKNVDGFAHDAFNNIFDKGKNAFEEIGKAIKKYLLDMLYQMTVKKWIFNVAVGVSGTAGAGAAMAAGGDVASGGGSWLSAGKSLYDGFSGAFTYDPSGTTGISGMFNDFATSSFGQSMGLSNAGTGAAFYTAPGTGAAYGGGATVSSTGSALGTAGSYLGAGLAGIGVGTMLAGDKKFAGMGGSTTSTIGAVAGAFFGGPIGAAIGGAIGGLFNAAFGSGPKQSGTTTLAGQFGEQGFAGQYQTPWSKSGGWFSSGSSGVDTHGVSATQLESFKNVVSGTKSVYDNLITASGSAQQSITGWTYSINQQVATEKQANELTIAMAESMGNYMIPALEQFKLEGENLADTAVRMRDIFIVTDSVLRLVGGSFGAVGLASMTARDNLVNLMGGLQQMNTAMQSYYQNFFTDAERHANDLGALTVQFAQLGLSIPQSAAGFKSLVSAQDLSTESGRQMFAALMSLNGAFAALIPSAEAAAQAIRDNISALQDQALANYEAARKATDGLRAFATSVRELQQSLWAGSQTPLSSTYNVTRSQFAATNTLAGAGDTNAQGSLAGAATAFLDASKKQAMSAIEYARDFAFVQNALSETASKTEVAVTVADKQLIELGLANGWLAKVSDYTDKISGYTNTMSTDGITANFNAEQTLKFITNADGIPEELRSALGTQSRDFSLTLKAALDSAMPDDIKRALITGSGNYDVTIAASLGTVDEEARTLALGATGTYLAIVNSAMGLADDESKKLALTAGGDYLATVAAALGIVDPTARILALNNANALISTVTAALSSTTNKDALTLATKNVNTYATEVTASLATDAGTVGLASLIAGATDSKLTVNGAVIFDPSNPMMTVFKTMNDSLSLLLTAAIASNEAARMAVVEQAITGLTSEIAAAIGSTYDASKLTRTAGAAGETALSYAGAYKTVGGTVSATGTASALSESVSASQQESLIAKNRTDSLNAQRSAAQSEIDRAKSIAVPTTYINGQTSDAAWETVLSRFNAAHQAQFGIPMNRPWGSDVDAASVYSSLSDQYRAILVSQAQSVYDAIPAFATGTNEVPYDMTARIHAGEEIKPRVYVDKDKSARDETNRILSELKAEIVELKRGNLAIATNTHKTAKILDKFDGEGLPETRLAA